MSLLSYLLHLGVTEENAGVFLVWRCPQCETEQDFDLIKSEGNVSLLGLPLTRPETMLDLRCCNCRYEIRVSYSERALLDRAGEATRLLKAGGLAPRAYVASIQEIPARFVEDLLAVTQTWKCPKCGEANPTSFNLCWNCSSKEGPQPRVLDGTEKPVPGFPRGGNPWE
jgi:hypothetical protein